MRRSLVFRRRATGCSTRRKDNPGTQREAATSFRYQGYTRVALVPQGRRWWMEGSILVKPACGCE